MRIAFIILACLCLVTLMACRSARTEPRLQGTWRSNKDETVSQWRRDGVLTARVIERFESEVLGKMSVTYSGIRVTSTTGNNWTEVSEYRVVESGDDFVVFDQFSDVYKRTLRYRVRFMKDGYWISNDEILKGYTEKFDLVSR
ncbi:MAG TPA: hypothetical protein VEC99_17230 [Clostridia bacterium]|nr:hypothetical protein [Clostridia bacterium]